MTIIIGFMILVGGASIACVSERYPKTSRHLERVAGMMLITGMSLVAVSRAFVY